MTARVIIADPNPDVLRSLKALLRVSLNYDVVGEFTTVGALPRAYADLHPDLVLLDWQILERSQVNLIDYLAQLARPPKIIVMGNDGDHGRLALAAGANAYISKGDPVEWLLEALRRVSAEDSSNAEENPDRKDVV